MMPASVTSTDIVPTSVMIPSFRRIVRLAAIGRKKAR